MKRSRRARPVLLHDSKLEDDYAAAWAEWQDAGEQELWEAAVGDGLTCPPEHVGQDRQ